MRWASRFLCFFGLGVEKSCQRKRGAHFFSFPSFLKALKKWVVSVGNFLNDWWCAFVISEILSSLKLMAQVLLAPLELVISNTGILRLFTFVGCLVGFFALLATGCYKLVSFATAWLNDDVFASDASESWLQFVGYILNFDLLYSIFVFYYSIFCLFVISFVVTYTLEIMSAVVPEFIEIFRHLLKTLTGGN